MRKKNNPFFQWPFVTFTVSLFFSVIIYIVFNPATPKHILFIYFPDNFGGNFRSEIRTVPKKQDMQAAIRTYVEEAYSWTR